jgi:hypothetical protein
MLKILIASIQIAAEKNSQCSDKSKELRGFLRKLYQSYASIFSSDEYSNILEFHAGFREKYTNLCHKLVCSSRNPAWNSSILEYSSRHYADNIEKINPWNELINL